MPYPLGHTALVGNLCIKEGNMNNIEMMYTSIVKWYEDYLEIKTKLTISTKIVESTGFNTND